MGVKSLWELLTPVGRPVMLETMEGKAMAIDSSIWIYQFQATMRDKEGRGLVNAHVVGFLRRICKLMYYGIKPVFVFDGGAPALKRSTLTERKNKKNGAAASHQQIAEKLLAAQMRREVVNQAQAHASKGKGKAPAGPITVDEDTVYLEDIDPTISKTPAKAKQPQTDKTVEQISPPSTSKKTRWQDHDPYRLPDIDMGATIAKATNSAAPDPRLATEEELQAFIDEMRPEDLDVTSPAFRELPTEVQYEIIGDLRLKSRQTSYKRLQSMLRNARTSLDFSKEQIKNLKLRNALTQQLLVTTDTIGKANITIPVRIAAERNRQYVLVKNDADKGGGWILGRRDEGTIDKPIQIDADEPDDRVSSDVDAEEDEDSDMDMEPVPIPAPPQMDPDLRDLRRGQALTAIARRDTSKKLAPLRTQPRPKATKTPQPLFQPEPDDDATPEQLEPSEDEDDDMELIAALEQSAADAEELELQRAIEASTSAMPQTPAKPSSSEAHISPPRNAPHRDDDDDDDDDDLYATPNRLETALAIGGAAPRRFSAQESARKTVRLNTATSSSFGTPSLLLDEGPSATATPTINLDDSDDDMEDVLPRRPSISAQVSSISTATSAPESVTVSEDEDDMEDVTPLPDVSPRSQNDEDPEHWSRTPSPGRGTNEALDRPRDDETWDAAQEMDPQAEEGDFLNFVSQVKGKDLSAVRKEIDEEIRVLNQQRKAAMRDSEEITHQMVAQIMTMLRLFGIPYITAPMEAEAQCATLNELGLVDGIITDDSDVFLFGGKRVLKNMFNQSKTVECFLLPDLARELGLDRDTLIRLAYLLGSDYTEGLPGVGPVVAMELLKEFQGEDGLHKFKDWWRKVQMGRDREADTSTKFRKRFKKRFKDVLHLNDDWPNGAVRDAYYHPTVDESEEPFKWGLPDLDALRGFLYDELGWGQTKVDELLLPIIHKVTKRGQAAARNQQGTLNEFLDISGTGSHAPRKRQAYASKRLQQVVSEFRTEQARRRAGGGSGDDPDSGSEGIDATRKRKTNTGNAENKRGATKGKIAKSRGRGGASTSRKRKVRTSDDEDEYHDFASGVAAPAPEPPKRRPRPRPVNKRKAANSEEPEE
ncbi:PIN domain-like protein [Punctularia strigosozonata HHB-11173 SS5]|uniref:PIN domain-like protein n=1 Tax=Punctularia strigosozonata (strain HHB-11173) TaxID=741275 RepID=UPI00044165A8|nr:PIN domain-like protein [Punctularia strigosozonata HHB-11173 SS5]EIN09779.1 PIN domain-like protein [Punctularia strigosozonata HHB-11173 SS5]